MVFRAWAWRTFTTSTWLDSASRFGYEAFEVPMGHKDVKTAMQYQHPELESVRMVINDRNSRHNLRHKTEFLQ